MLAIIEKELNKCFFQWFMGLFDMKWAVLLIFLISCAPVVQETVTKPVVEEKVVIPQPAVEPVVEPVIEAEKTPVVQKEPEPVQKTCMQFCEDNCQATAQISCSQVERAKCRDICFDDPVIDDSACTQACAYLSQPNVCKSQMERFCTANCVKVCH